MSKATAALDHWKRKQEIKKINDQRRTDIIKWARESRLGSIVHASIVLSKGAKYLFYAMIFNLVLIEFKINMALGKFFVAGFNLVNKHKLRVNRVVQYYANKCGETTK
jgi:hypothetical protein